MSELSEILERFRRGPELVATVMTGAAGAELDWAPEGQWSVRQILAHLADSEIVAADRLRRTIAESNPTLIWFDQDAWAAKLNYAKRRTSESLETFRRLRGENYELIRELAGDAWERTAQHSVRGTLTLRQLLELNAAHAESHARQIRGVRDQYREQRRRQ